MKNKTDKEKKPVENPTESFKKYCQENPTAPECKIYDV